jgi:hypothetical protein
MIDDRSFVSYLEDHLAGSHAGLGTVRRLRDRHPADGIGLTMARFEHQIEVEQRALQVAISRLGGGAGPSLIAHAVGAVGSVAAIARRIMVPEPVPSTLEDLEALAVGVWGKRLLWGALARKASEDDRLTDIGIDIESLIDQAEAQEIELLRLRDGELDTLASVG